MIRCVFVMNVRFFLVFEGFIEEFDNKVKVKLMFAVCSPTSCLIFLMKSGASGFVRLIRICLFIILAFILFTQ